MSSSTLTTPSEVIDSAKRLKIARMLTSLNAKEFSIRHDLSYDTFHKWEAGKIAISKKTAQKCVYFLQKDKVLCSIEWLLTGKGEAPRLISSDSDKAQRFDLLVPEHKNNFTLTNEFEVYNEIEFFKNRNKNAIVVMVKDNAMEPFYSANDYVGGLKMTANSLSTYNKRNHIVEMRETGERLIRKVFVKGKSLALVTTNPFANAVCPLSVKLKDVNLYLIVYHRKLPGFEFDAALDEIEVSY